jgi:2-polyprenyl-3-methyl-5-hydroxy-6-metoxy-1,4-benzoquinol methylase
MKQDNMPQVARFWNTIAEEFDSIYTGANKSGASRFLDRFFRQDIYQRFDWVMEKSGDVRGKTICDIGCGSGRFVTEFAKRGAAHVTGVDVAPDMLKLAKGLVDRDGVEDKCDFELNDVLNWKTDQKFDVAIAIGFWDYIQNPPERLRLIRNLTKEPSSQPGRASGLGACRCGRCDCSTFAVARCIFSASRRCFKCWKAPDSRW